METQLTFGKALSYVIGWTVLGFGVLLVIGPVLAVVGTILPFALIGFLSWAGYRAVQRLTHHASAEALDERILVVRQKLAPDGEWNRAARSGLHRILRFPVALAAWIVALVVWLPWNVLRLPLTAVAWFGRRAWGVVSAVGAFVGRVVSGAFVQGRFATVIVLEVFCGIAVGGMLGGLAEQRLSLAGDFVLTGAAVGGFLGVLVALSTPEPRRKTPAAG
jgi:hypothetical protein